MRRFYPLLLALISLTLLGAGQRVDEEQPLFTFHVETTEADYPKFAVAMKMGTPAKQYYFKLMPSITDRDVEWYYSFLADDQTTFGCAFQLSRKGTDVLRAISTSPEYHGKLLAGFFTPLSRRQGPVKSYILIDRPVTDGVVVIWNGLTDEHLREFSSRFPNVKEL